MFYRRACLGETLPVCLFFDPGIDKNVVFSLQFNWYAVTYFIFQFSFLSYHLFYMNLVDLYAVYFLVTIKRLIRGGFRIVTDAKIGPLSG